MTRIVVALLAGVIACRPAFAANPHRPACVEIRDPGVGTYRICAPAPRRRR